MGNELRQHQFLAAGMGLTKMRTYAIFDVYAFSDVKERIVFIVKKIDARCVW